MIENIVTEILVRVGGEAVAVSSARVLKAALDKFVAWQRNNVLGEDPNTTRVAMQRLENYCLRLEIEIDEVIQQQKTVEDLALEALDRPEVLFTVRQAFATAAESDPGMTHDALAKLVASMLATPRGSRDAIALRRAVEATRNVSGDQLMLLGLLFTIHHYYPDVSELPDFTEEQYIAEVFDLLSPFSDVRPNDTDIYFLESAGLISIESMRGRQIVSQYPQILSRLMYKRRSNGVNTYPDHEMTRRVVLLHQGTHEPHVFGTRDISLTLPIGWTLGKAVFCVVVDRLLDASDWED